MRTDFDAVFLGEPHGRSHMVEVGAMEAAGHIGDIDEGHQARIIAHFIEAESLSHVTVDGCHPVTSRIRSNAVLYLEVQILGWTDDIVKSEKLRSCI